MSIEPDGKDWTWVIDRRCPQCGFDASTVDVGDVPALLRDVAARFATLLREGSGLATRPSPSTWSTLEYGAHVRDCTEVFSQRLESMLTSDDPLFADWDQDAAAIAGGYGTQNPVVVADELSAAADELADRFAAVTPVEYGRVGRRGNGSRFTVTTLARYFIHDPIHHWWDVTAARR